MEPTLESIEDYDGKESKQKKYTVYLVILFLIGIGVIYSVTKSYYDVHMPESFNPVVTAEQRDAVLKK